MGTGILKSLKPCSGTFSPGCLTGQSPKVEMLDVNSIGGFLEDWLERSIRFRTPATCGSNDSRLRLKSTCHWLSVYESAQSWLVKDVRPPTDYERSFSDEQIIIVAIQAETGLAKVYG